MLYREIIFVYYISHAEYTNRLRNWRGSSRVFAVHLLHINFPPWFYFYSLRNSKCCCAVRLSKQQKQIQGGPAFQTWCCAACLMRLIVNASVNVIIPVVPVIRRLVRLYEWSLLSPSSCSTCPHRSTRFLRNVGTRIPYYALSHPGWQSISDSLP